MKNRIKNYEENKIASTIGNSKLLKIIFSLLLFATIIGLLVLGRISNSEGQLMELKDIENYSWEQYQELTVDEKALIPDLFENMESYTAWYERMQQTGENYFVVQVLESGEKSVNDFTWEEYQSLSSEEKLVFPDYFDSMEAYSNWYEKAKRSE